MPDKINTPRHAVVIGGARGIGEAIVRKLAADGFHVTVADRLEKELAALRETLRGENVAIDICTVDIAQPQDLTRLSDELRARCGPSKEGESGTLYAAVNSVGIFTERRPLMETPLESFRQVFDVNVVGAYLFTQAVVPLMAPHASLVHIGSVNGEEAGADLVAYKMSKAAMHMMGRCLAMELAKDPRKIRSNIVAPGWVITPGEVAMLTQQGWLEVLNDPKSLQYIPLKRRTEAREIADAVGFLCSDAASAITGTVLPVDCGILACRR
jgi:NAD(P)-dependent dehydrogenase (short-subunit alcohol dehydrogenase family)